ncbi:MAG: SPL family radical SAM protein, partial [Granulosicoccaceae bacterium]
MIDTIYIEEAVKDHPRTLEVLSRYPRARQIPCEQYSNIFNRSAQNFRVQKQRPALVLANKQGNRVLPAPPDYGIGGVHNYYFSHLFNCLYDCRYCFLQGMYRSANYVLFVNYEDFFEDIAKVQSTLDSSGWYFSGYDCDSLAMEPVTGFVGSALRWFEENPEANLELRTKSTQVRSLLKRAPLSNVVVAASLSPDPVAQALEHDAPSLEKRLDALHKLALAGWQVGLRFDPLIWCDDYESVYREFFQTVFSRLPTKSIHSVSTGSFRLPPEFHQKMSKLYPREPLLAGPLSKGDRWVGFPAEREQNLLILARKHVLNAVGEEK